MNRITVNSVRSAFENVKIEANRLGVDTSLWILTEGSSTYGNAWGIYNREPETGARSTVTVFGLTRTAAYEGLLNMSAAFRLIPSL